MGYAKYTEDDNEMRMERYRTFDYLPYYSEYYSPLTRQKQAPTQVNMYQDAKNFYIDKED